jgi:hypothetical protein
VAKKLEPETLYSLICDVRFGGELFEAGWNFLGDDPLARSRPELFVPFAAGHRAIVAAREALERREREEAARQARALAPENPPPPRNVICHRRFADADNFVVEVGSLWPEDHQRVRATRDAFTLVQD